MVTERVGPESPFRHRVALLGGLPLSLGSSRRFWASRGSPISNPKVGKSSTHHMMYLQYGGYQTVCPVDVSLNHEMRAMLIYEPSPTREYDTVLVFFFAALPGP